MKTFRDRRGREWTLDVTVGMVERLRAHALALDLTDAADERKAEALYARLGDRLTFARLLYLLLEKQLTAAGLTPEEFADGLGGDTLDAAVEAFDEALADFFPPGRRAALLALRKKIDEIDRRAGAAAAAMFDGPQVAQLIDKRLAEAAAEALATIDSTSSNSVIGSAASSASTPDP